MLRTIELWGTPAERGRRHGQSLAAEIRQLRRQILTYLARISFYAGAVPFFGMLQVLARRFWPFIPVHLREEMAAAARGRKWAWGRCCSSTWRMTWPITAPGVRPWRWGKASPTVPISRAATWITRCSPRRSAAPDLVRDGTPPGPGFCLPGLAGIRGGMHRHEPGRGGPGPAGDHEPGAEPQGIPAALRFRQALEAGAKRWARSPPPSPAPPGTIGNNLLLWPRGGGGVGALAPPGSGPPPRGGFAHRHQSLSKTRPCAP